jgi:hypothetical protein
MVQGFFYRLDKDKYFIAVYDIPESDIDFSKSGHQIMFNKHGKKPVEIITCKGFRKYLKLQRAA